MTLERRRVGWAAPMIAAAVVVAACGTVPLSPGPPAGSPTPAGTAAPPTSPAVPSGLPSAPASDLPLVAPPAAILVTTGVRAPGEVGSYAWPGGAESTPWLPASALDAVAVPAEAELSIALPSGLSAASWTARLARADDPDAGDAVPLGEGTGAPAFRGPEPGAWVLGVHVVFENGTGDATWYWSIESEAS